MLFEMGLPLGSLASMRPRMIMRGKARRWNCAGVTPDRFNEAAHDHARKASAACASLRTIFCFNEAAHDHARKDPKESDRRTGYGLLQ